MSHIARPRSSLDRVLAERATTDGELREMARRAFIEREIPVFLPADLAQMPAMVRAIIISEAKRIYRAR